MTTPASSVPFSKRLPSENEKKMALQLHEIIAKNQTEDLGTALEITDSPGHSETIILNASMTEILMDLLRFISSGESVTLVPLTEMLTTQQAADILNVSRPYLIKLLGDESLKYELVGRHRRIRAKDLFTYKEKRDQARSTALEEMAEHDGELL